MNQFFLLTCRRAGYCTLFSKPLHLRSFWLTGKSDQNTTRSSILTSLRSPGVKKNRRENCHRDTSITAPAGRLIDHRVDKLGTQGLKFRKFFRDLSFLNRSSTPTSSVSRDRSRSASGNVDPKTALKTETDNDSPLLKSMLQSTKSELPNSPKVGDKRKVSGTKIDCLVFLCG